MSASSVASAPDVSTSSSLDFAFHARPRPGAGGFTFHCDLRRFRGHALWFGRWCDVAPHLQGERADDAAARDDGKGEGDGDGLHSSSSSSSSSAAAAASAAWPAAHCCAAHKVFLFSGQLRWFGRLCVVAPHLHAVGDPAKKPSTLFPHVVLEEDGERLAAGRRRTHFGETELEK